MEATAGYETQQESLVRRFLAKWKEAENRMAADPAITRPYDGGLRQCRFEVFPYVLINPINGPDTLQLLAAMHQRRRPGYLKDRLKD